MSNIVSHRVIGKRFDKELRSLFMYNPADPFACRVLFQGDNVWEFSREALMECLSEGTGGLLNATFDSDGTTVTMNLASKEGSIVVQYPHSELTTFIHMTYAVVPRGEEDLDIDGLISEILEKTNLN